MASPMPRKFKTKLRYFTRFSVDPGAAGTAANYVFTANGAYDPDITGVGHQPRGFDQIMPLYDHYIVIGSKCTIRLADSISTTQPTVVNLTLKDSATTSTGISDYGEATKTRSKVLTHDAGTIRLSMGFNPKKHLGRSHPMADPELKGSIASNPTEQAYYHVTAASLDPAINAGPILGYAVIDYIIVFIEPKQPSES